MSIVVRMTNTTDIPALAAELAAAHPDYDPEQQRLIVTLYRSLGRARPVTREELAESTGRSVADIAAFLDELPELHRDERGRVIAFGGLTIEPTSHVVELDGRTVYTWCALDTLFVPELLGEPARIRSTCPETSEVVSLSVDSTGAHDVLPHSAVMSLHHIDEFDLSDVIGTFCCFVHFFATPKAANTWTKNHAGSYVVTIAEGFEFGRLGIRDLYGEGLRS